MTNKIKLYACYYAQTHYRCRADGGAVEHRIEAFTTDKVSAANAWGKQPGNSVDVFNATWDEYDELTNGLH